MPDTCGCCAVGVVWMPGLNSCASTATFSTSTVKSMLQVAVVPAKVTCEPPGRGTKRTVPSASPVGTMSKTTAAPSVAARASGVAGGPNTPGSAPASAQPLPLVCLHDGTSEMPGSGESQGGASAGLQTVLVWAVSGALLTFFSCIEAGRPVWPTVASNGNVIDMLAATSAW